MSQAEVTALQQSVFVLQRNLFAQQVELDRERKQFEREKEKFEKCKSWVALLLDEPLRPYVDKLEEIVKAQRVARAYAKSRRGGPRRVSGSWKEPVSSRLADLLADYRHSVEADKARLRYQAYLEILTTERQYNTALQHLRQYFILPLREEALYSKKPVITNAEMETLLVLEPIEAVTVLNGELLAALEECYASNKFDAFGEVFLRFYRRFEEPYLSYLIAYNTSNELLTRLQNTNREFCILLKKCESSVPGATFGTGLNLQSYLIQPCQRLPRYQMLLKELLGRTDPNHCDVGNLKIAMEKIAGVVGAINNKKAEFEDQQKLQELQSLMPTFFIVRPGRRIIKDGPGVVHNAPSSTEREKCYILLCSDVCYFIPRSKRSKGVMNSASASTSLLMVLPTASLDGVSEPAPSDDAWAKDADGDEVGITLRLRCGTALNVSFADFQQRQHWKRSFSDTAQRAQKGDATDASAETRRLQDLTAQIAGTHVLSARVVQAEFPRGAPSAPKAQNGRTAVAVYPLKPVEGQDVLSFSAGNLIVDVERREGKEWYFGRVAGTTTPRKPFPKKYVRELPGINTNPQAMVQYQSPARPASPTNVSRSEPNVSKRQHRGTAPPLPAARPLPGKPSRVASSASAQDAVGALRISGRASMDLKESLSPRNEGLSRAQTVSISSGLCVQLVLRDKAQTTSARQPTGAQTPGVVTWNEELCFSGLAPRSQILAIVVDSEKNAVVDYAYVPINQIGIGLEATTVQAKLAISKGTLTIEVAVTDPYQTLKPKGQAMKHQFVDSTEVFPIWCSGCHKPINFQARHRRCDICYLCVHSGCERDTEKIRCVPVTIPVTESLGAPSRAASKSQVERPLSPGRVTQEIVSFGSLMKHFPSGPDPPIPSGLRSRLAPVVASLDDALFPAFKSQALKAFVRAMKLPRKTDTSEWMAVNTIYQYQFVRQLFAMIGGECNDKTCPVMSASPSISYKWADGKRIVAPQDVSARQYFSYLSEWIDEQFRDPSIFPGSGKMSRKVVTPCVKVMIKKLMRVICHIYFQHYSTVRLQASLAFKVGFAYMYAFQQEYRLLDKRADATTLSPMDVFIKQL